MPASSCVTGVTLLEHGGDSTRSRPRDRRNRRPPDSSVPVHSPRATARARSTSPRRGGCPPPPASRSHPRRGRGAPTACPPGPLPGRRTVRAPPPRPAHPGEPIRRAGCPPDGPAPAPGRWPEIAAHRGSSSWRTRLRTKAGSALLGSHTGTRPAAAQSVWVSLRRRARSGWRDPGTMPARPSAPAPRRRLTRMVSAWSSMVWPVAASLGSTASRAARARASRFGPRRHGHGAGLERRSDPGRRLGDHIGFAVRTGSQAVVDVHRGDLAPGGHGEQQQGQGIGTARDGTGQRGARRRKRAPAHQTRGEERRGIEADARSAGLLSHRRAPPRRRGL